MPRWSTAALVTCGRDLRNGSCGLVQSIGPTSLWLHAVAAAQLWAWAPDSPCCAALTAGAAAACAGCSDRAGSSSVSSRGSAATAALGPAPPRGSGLFPGPLCQPRLLRADTHCSARLTAPPPSAAHAGQWTVGWGGRGAGRVCRPALVVSLGCTSAQHMHRCQIHTIGI